MSNTVLLSGRKSETHVGRKPTSARAGSMALCFLGLTNFALGQEVPQPPDRFGAAVDLLTRNYFEPLSHDVLEERALRALLKDLDPYGSYMNAEEWAVYQDSLRGEYAGLGVFINMDEEAKFPQVAYLLIGSPAGHAGVRRGDHILKAGSQSLEGLSFEAVIALLRGTPGSVLELTVRRPASAANVLLEVERKIIQEPSVRGVRRDPAGEVHYLLDEQDGLGYIRILRFTDTTVAELNTALTSLRRQRMKGLILDLRDSSGGKLEAAIAVADLFLEEGRILTVVSREKRESFSASPGSRTDVPMVMLINASTVSSSEVLAGALVDNGRVIAMGQRTFGKGRIQKYFFLGDGMGGVVLSTGTFQRPSGKTIDRHDAAMKVDEAGIAPDPGMELILERSESEALAEEMARLDGPFVLLPEEQVIRVTDRVLTHAVEVLNAVIERGTRSRSR